ncbi:ABC transporter permease subunit [Acidisoma cellulosilytica]|uniref:ABC transporter permease subunit n=1 Tax=Acidisoma cellulosilyticum TaxID=2802395 RepID=A0A964E632_9PROT|nr:ABC transporter permease subunit [Acidisoma cellulosilyticum]MCB8883141.1 ABC transporter permease subunit [Acidisoma cellulosilyticum]
MIKISLPRISLDTPWMMAPALAVVLGTFVLPLGVILWYSLHVSIYGSLAPGISAANYVRIFTNSAYYDTLANSILFVACVSAAIVVIAFPFAYYVAIHVRPQRRSLYLVLTALPFLTSYLGKVIAWLNLLGRHGILNTTLVNLGVISTPLELLSRGRSAVVITFIYLLGPLAFLTIYSALERIDPNLFEAAGDLGARGRQTFIRVVLPAARNGILGGFALVYITLFGDYITPVMVGGTDGVLFVNLLVNQFGASMQWGFGAAMAVTMLATTFLILGTLKRLGGTVRSGEFTRRVVKPAGWFLRIYSIAFLIFLYAPIVLLLLFALNSSSNVGLPLTGLTLKWFRVAFSDPAFRSSLITSLEVGSAAAVIGTSFAALAAVSISRRSGLVRNGALFLLSAPMLMPPVVLGTGILIAMDAVGMTRGLWTLVAGHTLLSLPVALLVILARLEGVDTNQELAAMDLGATPLRVLTRVTLPQAAPALICALLLTFAFSLDEFILTFLITGSQTTLPLYIYGSIRFELSPSVIAGTSTILLLSIALIGLGALAYLFKRKRMTSAVNGGLANV